MRRGLPWPAFSEAGADIADAWHQDAARLIASQAQADGADDETDLPSPSDPEQTEQESISGQSLVSAAALCIGDSVKGSVVRIEPYGVFVECGRGMRSALLHRSDFFPICRTFEVGDELSSIIKDIIGHKISLTQRPSEDDVFSMLEVAKAENRLLEGTVMRVTAFGVFVDVGLIGLVHRSL
jgi:ribosomal protein S1